MNKKAKAQKHLNALLHRTRGGHSFHKVRKSIEQMDDQEAHEWYRFITNAVDEAKMQAKNQARNRGNFFASQLKDIDIEEVLSFLKGAKYGPAGKADRVYVDGNWGSGLIEWVTVDPQRRQRLDHYGNNGDGWEEDSWSDDYARPTQDTIQKQLDRKFGRGLFQAGVETKGFILVRFNPKKVNLIVPPHIKRASTKRVADLYLAKSIHEKQFEDAGALSGVDPQIAAVMVVSGDKKKDKVSVKPANPQAVGLSPSQKTVRVHQAVDMALGMLDTGKIGGNLNAIISGDNQIMDGHHRWAGAILAGGTKAKVSGYVAQIEGKKLVRILNILTKGYFGVRNGKEGTGDINDLNPQTVANILRDYSINGSKGSHAKSPAKVQEILIKAFGSVDNGIEIMSSNANLIKKKLPTWAPDRKDMPVIKKNQVPEAADLMNQGLIDWNKPYTR